MNVTLNEWTRSAEVSARRAHNDTVLERLGLTNWARFDEAKVAESHRIHLREEMVEVEYRIEGVNILCPAGIYHPAAASSSLFLLRHVNDPHSSGSPTVLEVGVGSGAVLLALAARWGAGHYLGVDISPRALLATRRNASHNGLTVETRRSDLFSAVKDEGFDTILFNAPLYDKNPLGRIEREIMCDPGGRLLERFLDKLGDHLSPRGAAYIVVSNIGNLAPLATCGFALTLSGAELFASGMMRAVIRIEHRGGDTRAMADLSCHTSR